MAKFKVGDKVRYVPFGDFVVEKVDADQYGEPTYHLKGHTQGAFVEERKLKAANSLVSTNAVVANALAARGAVAKNAVVTLIVGAKDQIKREIDNIKQLESDVSRVDGIESEVVRLIGMAHKSLADAYRKI